MASTRIETPSTSDIRMNSWRFSSHIWPTLVRNWMPAIHSASVGSTSLTKPCRCLTSEVTTWRRRGSGQVPNRSRASLVTFCSVVFLMRCSGREDPNATVADYRCADEGVKARIKRFIMAANNSASPAVYEHDDDSSDRGAHEFTPCPQASRSMDTSLESEIDRIAQEIERLRKDGDPEGR